MQQQAGVMWQENAYTINTLAKLLKGHILYVYNICKAGLQCMIQQIVQLPNFPSY